MLCSAVVDRDGPGHGRRPSRAIVRRDGSACTALLEVLDVVEAGPCAALTGARDRRDRPARRPTPARVNCGGGRMELTVATILVAFAGVFLSRAARCLR